MKFFDEAAKTIIARRKEAAIERAVHSINQLAEEELGSVFGLQADKKLAEIIREAIEGKVVKDGEA